MRFAGIRAHLLERGRRFALDRALLCFPRRFFALAKLADCLVNFAFSFAPAAQSADEPILSTSGNLSPVGRHIVFHRRHPIIHIRYDLSSKIDRCKFANL